jgi:uncharacterized lipoprotein NlpE involved in copper resistance
MKKILTTLLVLVLMGCSSKSQPVKKYVLEFKQGENIKMELFEFGKYDQLIIHENLFYLDGTSKHREILSINK